MECIESAVAYGALDENCPVDYSEACSFCIGGDLHSKWGDKSSALIAFRNGKLGCAGEVKLFCFSVNFILNLVLNSILVTMEQYQ